MIVLFIVAFFGLLSIFSYIQAQSYITTSTSTPDYPGNECSPDQVLYAWIWNLPPNGICPPYVNNLLVSNGILYQRAFISNNESGCCYFSQGDDALVSLVPLPSILIGMTQGKPTDNDLNQKPYTTVGNSIKYIVPYCDTNGYCIEYGLVSVSGNKGTYKVVKFGVPYIDDSQSYEDIQSAEIIVLSNLNGTFTLQGIYVGGNIVGSGSGSPAIETIRQTFSNGLIFPIPGERPS